MGWSKHHPNGLIHHDPAQAFEGYTLFAMLGGQDAYLVDMEGRVCHRWHLDEGISYGFLLDNGNLLRGARYPDPEVFRGGGQGGRLQEFTWDGKLVWDFPFATEDYLLPHDIAVLPNGNVLAIAWEAKSGTCSPT